MNRAMQPVLEEEAAKAEAAKADAAEKTSGVTEPLKLAAHWLMYKEASAEPTNPLQAAAKDLVTAEAMAKEAWAPNLANPATQYALAAGGGGVGLGGLNLMKQLGEIRGQGDREHIDPYRVLRCPGPAMVARVAFRVPLPLLCPRRCDSGAIAAAIPSCFWRSFCFCSPPGWRH